LVIDHDGDGGAGRAARLKARQQVQFFNRDSGMGVLNSLCEVSRRIWRILL